MQSKKQKTNLYYAQNVDTSVNSKASIKKIDETTFQLELFVVLSEKELRERHCKICKETHSSFFISEDTNCNWCKLGAYHRRADEMLAVKKEHYKNILRNKVEGCVE